LEDRVQAHTYFPRSDDSPSFCAAPHCAAPQAVKAAAKAEEAASKAEYRATHLARALREADAALAAAKAS
jgi:hypothetical protein